MMGYAKAINLASWTKTLSLSAAAVKCRPSFAQMTSRRLGSPKKSGSTTHAQMMTNSSRPQLPILRQPLHLSMPMLPAASSCCQKVTNLPKKAANAMALIHSGASIPATIKCGDVASRMNNPMAVDGSTCKWWMEFNNGNTSDAMLKSAMKGSLEENG